MPLLKAFVFSRFGEAATSPKLKHSFLQVVFQHYSQKFKYVLLLSLTVFFITINHTAFAHQVKTTGDVGATLHIEPNDTPRAGEPTKTWFALTRKGGKTIPLSLCNCELAVYAEPYAPEEPALLEPTLQPVTAERYRGIPGTEITFPRQGNYQLLLRGKPKAGAGFKPFELKFNVTVAAGTASQDLQDSQEINRKITEGQTSGVPFWAIAAFVLMTVGMLLFLVQRVRS